MYYAQATTERNASREDDLSPSSLTIFGLTVNYMLVMHHNCKGGTYLLMLVKFGTSIAHMQQLQFLFSTLAWEGAVAVLKNTTT